METQPTAAARLDPSLVGERVPLDRIPVIDFQHFLNGSPGDRRAIALKIGEACRNIGFFYLTGHGIPRAMLLVRETNQMVIGFYEQLGFEAIPRTLMRKVLAEKP